MDTLTANLTALRRNSPRLAEALERTYPREDIEWLDATEGPTARIGGRLLASMRPAREGGRLAGMVDLRRGVTLVAGFGLGYHVGAIADRYRKHGLVVVHEPDLGLLRAVLEWIDWSRPIAWNDVRFLMEPLGSGLAVAMDGREGMWGFGVHLMAPPSSHWRIPNETELLWKAAESFSMVVRTKIASGIVLPRTVIRNALMNLDRYVTLPGIADLTGAALRS